MLGSRANIRTNHRYILLEGPAQHAENLYPVLLQFHYCGLVDHSTEALGRWHIFLPTDAADSAIVACLRACEAVAPGAITGSIIEAPIADWSNQWKDFFQPVAIAPGLIITAEGAPSTSRIVLTPGMAFGTGQHPTTQLVARAIAADFPQRRWSRLLDIGTGSGILAMVAIAVGVAHADGVDNDPEAVRVARENVAKNFMTERITMTDALAQDGAPYPVIVANILLDPLCQMAATIARQLAPGGDCYLSGVLIEQVPALTAAFRAHHCDPLRTETQGEWALLHCRKH